MLDRAVRSVLKQSCDDWELIVVDDNPPTSPGRKKTSILMNGIANDSRIRYLKNDGNINAALSRNRGLAAARGDYIAFLDDDNEWLPDKLKKQLIVFDSSEVENLGLVYCNAVYIDRNGEPIRRTKFHDFKGNSLNRFLIRQRGIGSSLLLIKASVFKKTGGFKDTYSEQDFLLELQILDGGFGFDFCDEILVKSHVHEGERITMSKNKLKGMVQGFEESKNHLSRLTFFEKMTLYSEYQNKRANIFALRGMKSDAIKAFALSIIYNPFMFYRRKVLIHILLGQKFADMTGRSGRKTV